MASAPLRPNGPLPPPPPRSPPPPPPPRTLSPASPSSNVLGRALRGGSYLVLQKIFTFAINSFILRRLHLSVTGAVTVQFELALATVFLFRDSFRLAFLRMPSLVDTASVASATSATSAASAASRKQQLVNVAWISTFVSWALGALIVAAMSVRGSEPSNDAQKGLEGYAHALAMYCAAAMIEAAAEPMYLLAHSSVLVGWQVSAQGMAFLVRALVQYAGIFVLQLDGLLCYGIAELAYATTLLIVFLWFFYWKLRENKNTRAQGIQSLRELLPRYVVRVLWHKLRVHTHHVFVRRRESPRRRRRVTRCDVTPRACDGGFLP